MDRNTGGKYSKYFSLTKQEIKISPWKKTQFFEQFLILLKSWILIQHYRWLTCYVVHLAGGCWVEPNCTERICRFACTKLIVFSISFCNIEKKRERKQNIKHKIDNLFLEWESVAGGVKNPRIVVWAFHAGVKTESFAGKLSGVEGASVGQRAVGLTLVVALLLPLGEVAEAGQLGGVLHPLNDLFKLKKIVK